MKSSSANWETRMSLISKLVLPSQICKNFRSRFSFSGFYILFRKLHYFQQSKCILHFLIRFNINQNCPWFPILRNDKRFFSVIHKIIISAAFVFMYEIGFIHSWTFVIIQASSLFISPYLDWYFKEKKARLNCRKQNPENSGFTGIISKQDCQVSEKKQIIEARIRLTAGSVQL